MSLSCSDELYAPLWEVASELGQQALAARHHIQPGCLEVAGVPGVCHIAGSGGVVQEQGDFPIRIAAAYTAHIPKIGAVHAYEEVVVGIILSGELTGGVARTGDAVLGQLASGRGIDGIADLLAAGGGGGDMELVGQSGLLHQVLHNKFGHGTAANIAVADK